MNWLRITLRRLAGLFTKQNDNAKLDEELQAHIDALVRENIRRGMSAKEAEHAARREFGGIEQTKEIYRDQRSIPFFGNFFQDLRFAVRGLRRAPRFAAIAIITLALGIGANTAIFSVVYGILLRPLPNPEPERIVQITEKFNADNFDKTVDYEQLQFLRTQNLPFESFAAYTTVGFSFAKENNSEHINGLHASSDYFHVLGMKPILGREFLADEDRGDGTRVAILSYGLWKRRTGSDPNIVGQQILLDGAPFTVIGVMPGGFERINAPLFHGETDVWAPMALVGKTIGQGTNLGTIGRLKRDVSLQQARAETGILTEEFRKRFPKGIGPQSQLDIARYQSMLSADIRTMLLTLFGAVAFVLLIASANIANLLLGRMAARAKEIAVRTALGATRGRLFRQMITESLLLSVFGALLGLLLARFGLRAMLALSPSNLPRATDIHLDGWAFGFSFLLALVAGIGFGFAPALKSSKGRVSEALKDEGRTSGGSSKTRLRSVLVVSEIALSLVLLTGATLLIQTFRNVLKSNPGFEPDRVATVQIWLGGTKYQSTAELMPFYDEVLGKIQATPGVQSATVAAGGIPLERGLNMAVRLPGSSDYQGCDFRMVAARYFETMRIPLKSGKVFSNEDTETSDPVIVLNESLAKKLWPEGNVVGRYLGVANEKTPRRVIGVVGDVKSHLDEPAEPTAFLPMAQASYADMKLFEGWFATVIAVRTALDPQIIGKSLAETIHSVNPLVPTGKVRTMLQIRATDVAMRKFNMTLLSAFAGLALLLAAIGIYGVMAYNVAQRVREIGIRMALGANPRQVLQSVLKKGFLLTAIGMVLGVAGAFALTRVLQTYLFGVTTTDPAVFAGTAVVLGMVALWRVGFPRSERREWIRWWHCGTIDGFLASLNLFSR